MDSLLSSTSIDTTTKFLSNEKLVKYHKTKSFENGNLNDSTVLDYKKISKSNSNISIDKISEINRKYSTSQKFLNSDCLVYNMIDENQVPNKLALSKIHFCHSTPNLLEASLTDLNNNHYSDCNLENENLKIHENEVIHTLNANSTLKNQAKFPSTLELATDIYKLESKLSRETYMNTFDSSRIEILDDQFYKSTEKNDKTYSSSLLQDIKPGYFLNNISLNSGYFRNRYKLIDNADIQICKLPHTKNVINKIMNSKLLRRWKSHKIIFSNNDICSMNVSIFWIFLIHL
jgi:hypothetical protein